MATTDSQMEEVVEIYSETEGSSYSASDSDDVESDPDYGLLEETCGNFSNLSIEKKAKARVVQGESRRIEIDLEELEMSDSGLDEKDEKNLEKVQKIIDAGELEKLKVLECKLYLRKNGLRLTGKKDTLIQRIREHLEIINGGGERKYPPSSFVLNCKGDACTGDVVLFEQNVYEMFSIASRSASGPPCGKRMVAGRIVKESYGAAKQQHTFTIEVLWSKGEKPLPPLHPLLIKGRNLYRLKTLRQRWDDEGKRQKILMEKHSRGDVARTNREARKQQKEERKTIRENRVSKKEWSRNQSQSHPLMTKSKYHQHEKSTISINEAKPEFFRDHGETVATRPHHQMIYHMHNHHSSNQSQSHPLMTKSRYHQHEKSAISINEAKPEIFRDHGETVATRHHQQMIYHMHNHHSLKRSENCQIPYDIYHTRGAEFSGHYYYHNIHPREKGITETTNRFAAEWTYRKPLTSSNHLFPLNLNRESHKQKKLCRYHAQGRCHFGDNCKFLHDFREQLRH